MSSCSAGGSPRQGEVDRLARPNPDQAEAIGEVVYDFMSIPVCPPVQPR